MDDELSCPPFDLVSTFPPAATLLIATVTRGRGKGISHVERAFPEEPLSPQSTPALQFLRITRKGNNTIAVVGFKLY